jgi:hypothetical protein
MPKSRRRKNKGKRPAVVAVIPSLNEVEDDDDDDELCGLCLDIQAFQNVPHNLRRYASIDRKGERVAVEEKYLTILESAYADCVAKYKGEHSKAKQAVMGLIMSMKNTNERYERLNIKYSDGCMERTKLSNDLKQAKKSYNELRKATTAEIQELTERIAKLTRERHATFGAKDDKPVPPGGLNCNPAPFGLGEAEAAQPLRDEVAPPTYAQSIA